MINAKRAAQIFKVLSVDTRVQIIQVLQGGSRCVNALASRVKVTPAAISQHLRILRDANLVTSNKSGYHVHYSLNDKTVKEWQQLTVQLLSKSSKVRKHCSLKKHNPRK
ncbi:ArsR/SmtB family transcription factor [Planctomycetota bacterium]